jgi:hypothetical protein
MALPRFALVAHGPPRSRSAGLISGAPRSTSSAGEPCRFQANSCRAGQDFEQRSFNIRSHPAQQDTAIRFERMTYGLQNSWSTGPRSVSCIRVNALSSAPPRRQECTNRDTLLGARVRNPHPGGGGRAVEQRFFGILAARAATPDRARSRSELFGGFSGRRSDERSISSS